MNLFAAILSDEGAVAELLASDPAGATSRVRRDRLVKSVPHWLYVGDTPLHLAGAGLRLRAAKALLTAGADPNARNRRGATPLHYACDARPGGSTWDPKAQAALIELLVKRGANVDQPDAGGATPLHRAVRSRSASAVATLIGLGARTDVGLKVRGSTPLDLALRSTGAGGTAGTGNDRLQIVELLSRQPA